MDKVELIAYAFIVIWYVIPTTTSGVQNDSPNVSLIQTVPRYIAVGDENIVELTLMNLDAEESISGTVTLKFTNNNISVATTPDQRLSVSFKDLLPDDRLTQQFKVKLSEDPSVDSIEYRFLITVVSDSKNGQYKSEKDELLVSPIPRIRSFWSWVSGASGLAGLFIAFLFDRFKNLVGVE